MFIAVDIGGTKTSLAVFSRIDPAAQIDSLTYASPNTYDQSLADLTTHLTKLTQNRSVRAIGIAIASWIDADGHIENHSNLSHFHGHNLLTDLSQKFSLPIYVKNDAACAALAEAIFGHGLTYSSLLHFVISTGFGGVYIQKDPAATFILPLEPGSVIVQPGGMPHTRHQIKGNFESYLGGSQLEAQLNRPLDQVPDNHLIWQQVTNYLGLAVYNFSMLFSPDLITLSGGLISKRSFVLNQVQSNFKNFPQFIPPPVMLATSFDNPSLLGALILCRQKIPAKNRDFYLGFLG